MTNQKINNTINDINNRINLVESNIYNMNKTGIIKEKEVSYSSATMEIKQIKLLLRVLESEVAKNKKETYL